MPEIKLQIWQKDLPKGKQNPMKASSNYERMLFLKHTTADNCRILM